MLLKHLVGKHLRRVPDCCSFFSATHCTLPGCCQQNKTVSYIYAVCLFFKKFALSLNMTSEDVCVCFRTGKLPGVYCKSEHACMGMTVSELPPCLHLWYCLASVHPSLIKKFMLSHLSAWQSQHACFICFWICTLWASHHSVPCLYSATSHNPPIT